LISTLQQSGNLLANDLATARRTRKLDWFMAAANRKSLTRIKDLKRLKAVDDFAAANTLTSAGSQPPSQGLLHFPSSSALLDSGLGEAVSYWLLETSTGRSAVQCLDDGDVLLHLRIRVGVEYLLTLCVWQWCKSTDSFLRVC